MCGVDFCVSTVEVELRVLGRVHLADIAGFEASVE